MLGGLSVTLAGAQVMPVLCVASLDINLQVSSVLLHRTTIAFSGCIECNFCLYFCYTFCLLIFITGMCTCGAHVVHLSFTKRALTLTSMYSCYTKMEMHGAVINVG